MAFRNRVTALRDLDDSDSDGLLHISDGFKLGTTRALYGMDYGNVTGNTDAAGQLIIPHIMNITPTMINVTSRVTNHLVAVVAQTSTNFTIKVTNADVNTPVASASVSVFWLAFAGNKPPPLAAYVNKILGLSNLLAYWRVGEGAGTTAFDSSGLAHDAGYNGAVVLGQAGGLTGDADTAVLLPANTGVPTKFIEAPAGPWTNPASGHFTVMARIKTSVTSQDQSIIDKMRFTLGSGFLFYVGSLSGQIVFRLKSANADLGGVAVGVSGGSIADGAFHHVAGVCDGATLRVIVDGTHVDSVVNTNGLPSTVDGIRVGVSRFNGGDSPVNGFTGTIDEPCFIGAALTNAQVAAIAAAQ